MVGGRDEGIERLRHPRTTPALPGRVLLAVVLSVAVALAGLGPSGAQPPSRADLEGAKARLMELEKEFELVVERYNLVAERLDTIRAEVGATELRVGAIERRMGAREKMAVSVAVELYQAGEIEAVEGLLTAESFAELETRLSYLNSSERAQTKIFEALAADRDELNAVLEELSEKQEKVAAAEQELGDLTAEINEKLESQKDEIAALTAAIERAEERRQAREAAARAAAERAAQRAARRASQQAARPPTQPPQQAPEPSPDSPGPAPNPSGGAATAVSVALDQVGDPYQWGGAGPDSFDCSGLTMYAWAAAGVSLPHNSGMQYAATVHVAQSDWRPGDLLFYGSPIHHVGMYIGNGQMVEAPYTGAQVRVVSAFRSDYVGAGRAGV